MNYQKPLLIIGNARTGSNLWRSILNNHPEIFIAGELQLWMPYRKDFSTWFNGLGDLKNSENFNKLFAKLYSDHELESPVHTFWHRYWKTLPDWVPEENLRREFKNTDLSLKEFVRVLLEQSANFAGKKRWGAKNLAHFSNLPILRDWFPDSQVIHLIRDPRAIYASQVQKKANDFGFSISTDNFFYRLGVLLIVTLEWWRSYFLYRKSKEKEWYYMCRFEDLINKPEKVVMDVCGFLGIDYSKNILDVTVKASSFHDSSHQEIKGFDQRTLDRWKKHINRFEKLWFKIICFPALINLGYLSNKESDGWKNNI